MRPTRYPTRRALLLGAGACLLAAPGARAQATAAELIGAAEQALRDGRPGAAALLFERASRLDDVSATAELGMMRAYLQGGDYARAAAWGRLVAGEHPQAREALAWAEAVDGLARAPSANAPPAPAGVPPLPGPAEAAHAFAAAGGRCVGCGLVDGPRARLLAPPELARRLGDGAPAWVVDGTGCTWRLRDAEGRLERAAAAGAEPAAASRAPSPAPVRAHPGRPVLVLHPAAGAWPRLAPGLLTFPAAGDPRLGLASAGPAAPDGSPVFDACGRWLGWTAAGRLEPAPSPRDDDGCRAGPAGDVVAAYSQWYAAAATVWRAA